MSLFMRFMRGGALLCALLTHNSYALEPNTADIGFNVKLDPVVVVNNGKACTNGQYWDVGVGGCTTQLALRTATTTQACSCTCPEAGSCTAQQTGTYTVYGWRIPPSGTEVISSYSPTTWGGCQMVTNSCRANPPPPGPPPPTPGQQFIVDAFICNSSHPSYGSGPLGSGEKNQIIGTYRQFNYGQRCPELDGYNYWQSNWSDQADRYQQANPSASRSSALTRTWPTIQNAMNTAAAQNGEQSSSYSSKLDRMCTDYAYSYYGMSVSASYISGSGSSCRVN